jgi:hypothetical protein
MNSHFLQRSRFALFFAPDGGGGPSSGGSSPDAQLPANRDPSAIEGIGGIGAAHHSLPSQADIAQLAQQYWEEEGRPADRHNDHWFRAEKTLRQQAGLE